MTERSVYRRNEDRSMADLLPSLKRWAFLWPILVAAIALMGFRFLSPNARIEAVEAQQAKFPAAVKAAIDSQVAPLRVAIAKQEARDSSTQAQLQQMSRLVTVGALLQCRDLPDREKEFLRQLAQFCDQTSRTSGIPYRRP